MSRLLLDAATLFRRELLRYRRDRAYWVGQIALPLVVVAFLGFGLNDVVRLPTETDYLGHLASGMLALLVTSGAVGGGFTLIQDRESGFLRALVVAPVSAASLVLGKVAARVAVSLVLVALLVAVFASFTALRPIHWGAIGLAVIGLTTCFVALGVALAARLRSFESFRLIAALATIPLYLLSGIFYPVSTLPAPSRMLAWGNPLTYGADLLRHGLLDVHEIEPLRSALVLVALALVALVLAGAALERREPA